AALLAAPGRTWFVKVMAPASAIEPHRDDVLAFARTFRVVDRATEAPSGPAQAPQPGPMSQGDALVAATPIDVMPSWTTPEGWRPDPQSRPPLVGGYLADGDVRITVTPLSGAGGGALANIN